ncbi:MAG TPA: hypothetical protein VI231_05085 [Candidatus Binatia bacterium]|jgi:uncharacterized membrane protein YeaQ/YmgE (transglycosylase-associated protein family)
MNESAAEALRYLQDNLLFTLVIALVVGFLASKTVTQWEKSNIAVYFIIGVLGTFLGQFVSRYIGLQSILELASSMELLFDVVLAYFGSFVVAALIHMFKPM